MSQQKSPRRALAILLAAGEGTRMKSAKPKALHEIAGRSMLAHVLATLQAAGADAIALVIGPDHAALAAEARRFAPDVEIFIQHGRRGTTHATLAARAAIARGYDDVLVTYVDIPLLRADTLRAMREALAQGAALAALGFEPPEPGGYGRFIERDGALAAIREDKDASTQEKAIRRCNAGPVAFSGDGALARLDAIKPDNAQREYYLTDLVETTRAAGLHAVALMADARDALGVNDRVQLAQVEGILQDRLRHAAMLGGATLTAPETVFLAHDTKLGRDVLVEPNVVFGPGVRIGDGAIIHAFCHLEGALVAPGAQIGPYARLRKGSEIGEGAKVGNFVETKSAKLGKGAKVNHLSYIGDAEIGAGANIGAGTITCNYDGYAKFKTNIGAGAFVGSNSSLVAPVVIGDGAYVGSGSVVTKDVPADALAVARPEMKVREGWAKRNRERKGKG